MDREARRAYAETRRLWVVNWTSVLVEVKSWERPDSKLEAWTCEKGRCTYGYGTEIDMKNRTCARLHMPR